MTEFPVPPDGSPVVGMMEGEVDRFGNVTFTSVNPARVIGSGVSAAIYGSQNVNARLYTSRATIDSTPTTKTWHMPLGLRNLLSYPIGSNQGGVTPSDTSGVYVALIGGPTVTATSGSCASPCTVRMVQYDGTASFTSPNQPYMYWHERLAAVQPAAAGDTVSARRSFVFTGPRAVTNFRFVLIVSAAWPPPNETFWSTFYNAATDSEPDLRAAPPWKKATTLGNGTETWSASTGRLTLGTSALADLILYRADSLAPATNAYIEARLKLNSQQASGTAPQAAFGLGDGQNAITVGIARQQVGFVHGGGFFGLTWSFIGSTYSFPRRSDATALHTYTLRKFGTDSATIEIDGTRVLRITQSQFDGPPFFVPAEATAYFGVGGTTSGNVSSDWAYVTYGIGQSQP
ncbi:MAG: hypothetical protein IRY91_06645 [Gemmatimonadaceae bacterium]|nr:hypothetical protein [Gemmatimonadaceae bacterium]